MKLLLNRVVGDIMNDVVVRGWGRIVGVILCVFQVDCAHDFRLVSVNGQRSKVTEQAGFTLVGSTQTIRSSLWRKCTG